MTVNERVLPRDEAAPALKDRLAKHWRWGLVLAYMAVIFALSSASNVTLPGPVPDKVAHGGAYGVLSALIVWATCRGVWTRVTLTTVLVSTVASLSYGITDEIHQLFVPNRQFEVLDLAADASGAFLAACALWAWGIIPRGSARNYGL